MGMLDKARTKARIAPVVVRSPLPFEPGASWRLQNGIAAAALVRGAFSRIPTRQLTSGTLRGRQGSIARALNDQASSLWFVQHDDSASWTVRLGVRGKTGQYYVDWAVRVDCREDAGAVEATISTPGYLTRDGALVNGRSHDEMRDLLVEAFRGADGGVGAAAEEELGRQSLGGTVILDEPVDFGRFQDCAVRTSLTDDVLEAVLRRVCMPLIETSARSRVYRLGLERFGVPSSFGTVSWEDAPDPAAPSRIVHLHFDLHPTGALFLDAMATRAAASLARRLRNYIAIEDDSLEWVGPQLYSWVW